MQTSKKELVVVLGCFFIEAKIENRIKVKDDEVKKREIRKNRLAFRGEVCLIHRVAFQLCYQANVQKAKPDTELKCASAVV